MSSIARSGTSLIQDLSPITYTTPFGESCDFTLTLTSSHNFLIVDETTRTLTLQSNDFTDVGQYEVELKATPSLYAEYLSSSTYPFTVNVCMGCQDSEISMLLPEDMNYTVNEDRNTTSKIQISLSPSCLSSEPIVTYRVLKHRQEYTATFLDFESTEDGVFDIFTEDSADIGDYVIEVTARIDDLCTEAILGTEASLEVVDSFNIKIKSDSGYVVQRMPYISVNENTVLNFTVDQTNITDDWAIALPDAVTYCGLSYRYRVRFGQAALFLTFNEPLNSLNIDVEAAKDAKPKNY